MSAASLASASTSGEGASARRAEGRASNSKADKEQVQGVRRGKHVRAQASKNLLQAMQRDEHLRAQSEKALVQGVYRASASTGGKRPLFLAELSTTGNRTTSLHEYRNTLHTFGAINHSHMRKEGSAQPATSRWSAY